MFLIGEHIQFCTCQELSPVSIFSLTHHRHTEQRKMSKIKEEMIVSVNPMYRGKMSCHLLQVGQANRCASCVRTP